MSWGPRAAGDGLTRFRLWAPDADAVRLEIVGADAFDMHTAGAGWFQAYACLAPGTRYRFRLSDGLAVPDPASRRQDGGVHGWSVLTDPAGYDWQVRDWRGRPWEQAVILEVHAGVLGGFSGVADRLEGWRDIGITAIELMPIAAFDGARGWGYDGVLPYAVHESYGTPDDLKALVDRAHSLGMMMMLDVVYNHFGPSGNYLGAYARGFLDEHVDTPWGGAVAVSKSPVRRYFIDNALMWLQEYRFDGLRFDAVHAIADSGFLDEMAAELRARCDHGRHIHLILENERNDPERLVDGRYDAQWNDDFHNVLHVLLTGEDEGYYSAFSEGSTEKLARCLAEGFIYQGETPPGGDHPRGAPSGHLRASAFVAFLQNHDQIGNRALGERLTLLTDSARLRAAIGLLLLCPQIPLLFTGDEAGSRSPFLFFTDFHDTLADAVREGRRREFATFAAFADAGAREHIPDPNAAATFDRSVPQPGPDAEDWRALYSALLAVRHAEIVPRLHGASPIGAAVLGEGAVLARWRMSDEAVLSIAVNLGQEPVEVAPPDGRCLWALGRCGDPASFVASLST